MFRHDPELCLGARSSFSRQRSRCFSSWHLVTLLSVRHSCRVINRFENFLLSLQRNVYDLEDRRRLRVHVSNVFWTSLSVVAGLLAPAIATTPVISTVTFNVDLECECDLVVLACYRTYSIIDNCYFSLFHLKFIFHCLNERFVMSDHFSVLWIWIRVYDQVSACEADVIRERCDNFCTVILSVLTSLQRVRD